MIRRSPMFTLEACRVNNNFKIGDVANELGVIEKTVIHWERTMT